VPLFERYYLGSEFDIRGYNTRSISPVAPVNSYVTSRNVIVASNQFGTPVPITGISDRSRQELAQIGTFTGATGSNPALISRAFAYIGGDTQIVGNFEYRIPIFGPLSLAAFVDAGTVFNLRKGSVQSINSEFLPDQPFLGFNDLSIIFLRNNTRFQPASPFFGGILIRDSRPISRDEYTQLVLSTPIDPNTGFPLGVRQIFLRGEAQTNQQIRVNDSAFANFRELRSSVGMEVRVQVPVVDVPFRLMYFYNPNARRGFYDVAPNFFLNEKKSGWRFTVGRTF
jgi:outer membrane protein insertion porin family